MVRGLKTHDTQTLSLVSEGLSPIADNLKKKVKSPEKVDAALNPYLFTPYRASLVSDLYTATNADENPEAFIEAAQYLSGVKTLNQYREADFINEVAYFIGLGNDTSKDFLEKIKRLFNRLNDTPLSNFLKFTEEFKIREIDYSPVFLEIRRLTDVRTSLDVDALFDLTFDEDVSKLYANLRLALEISTSSSPESFKAYMEHLKKTNEPLSLESYESFFEASLDQDGLKKYKSLYERILKSDSKLGVEKNRILQAVSSLMVDSLKPYFHRFEQAAKFYADNYLSFVDHASAFSKILGNGTSVNNFIESFLKAQLYTENKEFSQEELLKVATRKYVSPHFEDFLNSCTSQELPLNLDRFKEYIAKITIPPNFSVEHQRLLAIIQAELIDRNLPFIARHPSGGNAHTAPNPSLEILEDLDVKEDDLIAFIKALQNGDLNSEKKFKRYFNSLVGTLAIDRVNIEGSQMTDAKVDEINKIILDYVGIDEAPKFITDIAGKPFSDPFPDQAFSESKQALIGAHENHRMFYALTYEARSTPDRKPPLLVRFANDCASNLDYINARDPNQFPGRGSVIYGLNPYNIFYQEDMPNILGDIFRKKGMESQLAFSQDVFSDLSNTRFIVTRGMIAVSSEGDAGYEITGRDGKPVHYSYVFFNDHFENRGHKALLVPTQILDSLTQPYVTGSPFPVEHQFLPKNFSFPDINESGFQPEKLFELSEKMGLNVFDIADPVCYGPGMQKSAPVGKAPFDHWDDEDIQDVNQVTVDTWRDNAGKAHYYFVPWGSYNGKTDREWLEAAQDGHNQVFRVVNNYQNLTHLFKLGYSQWKKGYSFESVVNNDQSHSSDSVLTKKSPTRMVEELVSWNKMKGREGAQLSKEDYPVLVDSDAFFYSEMARPNIVLDSFDMTCKVRAGSKFIQVAKGEDQIKKLFMGDVDHDQIDIRQFFDTIDRDLRFYHRDQVDLAA